MIQIDKHDVIILDALQKDGRATRAKLARIASLSPSAIHDRIARLEKCGVICSYNAVIDLQKLLNFNTLFVEISLRNRKTSDFDRFEQKIRETPAVVECLLVAGECDYILRFAVTSIDEYQRTLEDLLNQCIGINRYYTYIVTKNIKEYSGMPLVNIYNFHNFI